MLKIVAYDIIGGENKEEIGTFDSVQMTNKELRDPEGNVILTLFDGFWFSAKTGNAWYDWTVEVLS